MTKIIILIVFVVTLLASYQTVSAQDWFCCGFLIDGCIWNCCFGYDPQVYLCDSAICKDEPDGKRGSFVICYEIIY